MPDVRIAEKRLWIGDDSHLLLSGELHYWRLNPHTWRTSLRKAREMGLKLVASYVCWDYHEISPGEYDFTGRTDPQRDLIGFIEAVAAEGLWLIIRPGPYIYSEWTNGGIPDYAARFHRLHPQFQQAAAHYISAVSEVIKPFLATNGGPVVLLQAENEPDPWPQFYEEQLGLGTVPGPFQRYLSDQYESVEALNTVWETTYTDFNEARAVLHPAINDRGYLNRYLDFYRFRQWCTTETVRWTVEEYRAAGIDVPIYANTYVTSRYQNWRDIESLVALSGPDFYPSNEFDGGTDEHQNFLHLIRYTRTYSKVPYIPEFEAGIWHGGQGFAGNPTPNHYVLTCLSALLAGVAGWNWFMLVNRDNWLMSPINEWGRQHSSLYEVFKELTALVHELDPSSLEKVTSTALTTDVLHRTAEHADNSGDVLSSLYAADVDYECYDVATGRVAKPLLIYGGGDQLERAAQERLLTYVEDGGHLVFFQNLPVHEEHRDPCNVLELARPERILGVSYPQQIAVRLGEHKITGHHPVFFAYDRVPGEPITAVRVKDVPTDMDELSLHTSLPVGIEYTVGYRKARGKGSIIVLGVKPTPEIITALHGWLSIPLGSQSNLPHIQTALFRRNDAFFVIAVNNGQDAANAVVTLDPAQFAGGQWQAEDMLNSETSTVHPARDQPLVLPLARKSGTVIRLTRID